MAQEPGQGDYPKDEFLTPGEEREAGFHEPNDLDVAENSAGKGAGSNPEKDRVGEDEAWVAAYAVDSLHNERRWRYPITMEEIERRENEVIENLRKHVEYDKEYLARLDDKTLAIVIKNREGIIPFSLENTNFGTGPEINQKKSSLGVEWLLLDIAKAEAEKRKTQN